MNIYSLYKRSRYKDKIIGTVNINRKTKSLIFLSTTLKSKNKIIATSSGIWKILNFKTQGSGYGG